MVKSRAKKKQSLWKIVALILLAIALLSVGFTLRLVFSWDGHTQLFPAFFPTPKPAVCRYHDYPLKKSYLMSYIVKKGDTLLSIANEQMGSTSRVVELIKLNRNTHPGLSLDNPNLEIGWELLVAPKDFPITSGDIFMVRGPISELNSDDWYVTADYSPETSPFRLYGMSKGTYLVKRQQDYRVGDCVIILYDAGDNQRPIYVKPQ